MHNKPYNYSAILPDLKNRNEIKEWCTSTFGESCGISTSSRWFMLDYTIQFKYENDRNWFRLRWGCE